MYFLAGSSLYRYEIGAAAATPVYQETQAPGAGDVAVDAQYVYFSEPALGCIIESRGESSLRAYAHHDQFYGLTTENVKLPQVCPVWTANNRGPGGVGMSEDRLCSQRQRTNRSR